MKIAVIGKGKTGGAVESLAGKTQKIESFDSKNSPSARKLRAFDAAIVFVPAAGFADLVPALIESEIPMVIGTTGFSFENLPAVNAPWITASNFSLGMNFLFAVTQFLPSLRRAGPRFHIQESHHVHKKDSPSGTALHLQSLLPNSTEITAERSGDIVGIHTVITELPFETLTLRHEAQDRSVFASGALYAAEFLLPGLPIGVHKFETILANQLKKEFFHA